MPYKTAAPARTSGGRGQQSLGKDAAKASRRRGSETNDLPALGTRIEFREDCCAAEGDATYTKTRNGPDWLIGSRSTRCPGGGECLSRLGDALGLGSGATKEQIATALKARGRQARRAEARPLPSMAHVAGWHQRLLASDEPLRYLQEERGLSLDVIRDARIGWGEDWLGRPCLTFPMLSGSGELVAIKTRAPRAGAQMKAWPGGGRAWPLYPDVPPRGGVLLVAGELDALRARSAGLPAVSVTLGAGYWAPEWTDALRGRRVVVCFDNNEVDQARERVARLREAGVRASRLSLRKLGLRTAKGDLSDFLNNGGSVEELRAAANKNNKMVPLTRAADGRDDARG